MHTTRPNITIKALWQSQGKIKGISIVPLAQHCSFISLIPSVLLCYQWTALIYDRLCTSQEKKQTHKNISKTEPFSPKSTYFNPLAHGKFQVNFCMVFA